MYQHYSSTNARALRRNTSFEVLVYRIYIYNVKGVCSKCNIDFNRNKTHVESLLTSYLIASGFYLVLRDVFHGTRINRGHMRIGASPCALYRKADFERISKNDLLQIIWASRLLS